ncbi:MAG: substrate-binding domain-containing protein [Pseudaminobacter sp.]
MTTISIMSGIALRGAFETAVLPAFTQVSGFETQVCWGPTTALMDDIVSGERADVAVLTDVAIRQLTQDEILDADNQVTVAQAVLGLAARQGDARPDISTKEAFIDALLSARSIAFSRGGASGIYFNKLIDSLGIGERIRARATIIPGGFTAEKLVDGEADIAVQQISELIVVPGVEVVGRFPDEFQSATTFRAGVFKHARHPSGVAQLIQALVTEEARSAYRAAGLIPDESPL